MVEEAAGETGGSRGGPRKGIRRVAQYGAGDKPLPRTADFRLIHGKGFLAQLIRFGQWLRFHGRAHKYEIPNHAALIVDGGGWMVEPGAGGVNRNTFSEFT